MDWFCCFCRAKESEDLSTEAESFLREGDTAEPSNTVPATVSDSFRRSDDSALDEPSAAVCSAVSSSFDGSLEELRPLTVDPSTSAPAGGLAVSRCAVDGPSPPSPSPFFSSVTDSPSSTGVAHISTDPFGGSSDPSTVKPCPSPTSGSSDASTVRPSSPFSASAFDPAPSHPAGSVVSTPVDVPPSNSSRTEPLLGSGLSPSCSTSISPTSHATGSCSPSYALDLHSLTSIMAALSPSVNEEVESPTLATPDFNSSLSSLIGPSSSSTPPSDSPPHESLASPVLSMPGTSKPSASPAPRSGLFQSFAQTPISPVSNPCARASCLYNKPGRLCTIFDQRYVYIGHKDTFILVELKRRISCGLILGTRLVWKQGRPHLLSDLTDGAKVTCDALSLPDTHGFHALVVWQDTKPNLIEEPAEEGEVMVLERYDLQVKGMEASKGGGGSMDVDLKGKSLKVNFVEEVVFVDGERSSIIDIFTSFYKFNYSVFATLHKVLGSGENLSYICSCIWTGTRPTADLLVKIEQGNVFNKDESGTYIKCTASQRVYCDLPAILKTSEQGRQIVLRYGDKVRHLPVRNEDIFYESERNITPLPPETSVVAHILRLKGGNRPCVLKVIGVHLTRVSIQKSRAVSKSNESEEVLNFISKTKEISKQSKSEVKQFVHCEMNAARKKENSQIEHDQEKEKIQSENNQQRGKIQPKKVESVRDEENIFQKKTPVTEEQEMKVISVEDCMWHYGSISQGIALTLQKSILITYNVLYVNGQRISATDTVAKYSEKGSTVSVAAVPLVPPCQVLGVTVTHKALAAWQGIKPECVEEIIEAYASGSGVQLGTRVIPETDIRRSVCHDRVTKSAPSLHQNHVAAENRLESRCVEYAAGYRWKVPGISRGLLYKNSRVVLVKHEVFFVDKHRVPNTDPLSKFADKESKERLVNALVVPMSSPQVISGQTVTHEALVAWCGKKPDEADSYVAEYSKEKGKRSHIPNSPIKTSSLQEIGNTTRALPNPRDGKIPSTEKIQFSGKDETRGSVNAAAASVLPKEKPTTENRKLEPTTKKKVPDMQPQKKTPPRHAQGKLQKVVGDRGILQIHSRKTGERAMVAFHRSVTFLHQQRVDPKKGLEEQLSPHQADGKDFSCHIINHDMNMAGVACKYKATMVWLGKKPKTVTEQVAKTRVEKSQNTEKNNKATGVVWIRNASGTLAHASSQVAVLTVNNVAFEGGKAFVFVKGTDVYVHQRRLQGASEMPKHHIWQCNIRACKNSRTVEGFVCHYQAELAWVGKMPRKDDGKSSVDNSQSAPEKAKKTPLLPTPGPPRIENAQTTFVYVKDQIAVLRVNNKPLYASAHYTNAYVHRERVQNPNDMFRHKHWNCNLKKCDQSGLSVYGFMFQYEAELAWVGERPSQLGSSSSMYEELFPVIGPEDNTKIVNL